MEKEQNQNNTNKESETGKDENISVEKQSQEIDNENSSEKDPTADVSLKENKSLEDKIFDLEDKLARTFAEMENQRRRFEKEKDMAYEYGGFTFAKEALSLIDNLQRSKQILSNDEALKNSDALKKALEHFDIIYKDLISIFSKNNIKQIESLDKKLDPNLHQAMIEIEDNQKEPGTIIQEIQKGFTIKDRLLRPALVGVSKKTSNKTKKDEENKDNLEEK